MARSFALLPLSALLILASCNQVPVPQATPSAQMSPDLHAQLMLPPCEEDCGGGGGGGGGGSPPPPPTGPNLRVTVTMSVVDARDTEDIAGGFLGLGGGVDEFYTIGGVRIAQENTNLGTETHFQTGVVSAERQHRYTPNIKVFDNVIAPNSRFVVGYTGFDQDLGQTVKTITAIGSLGSLGIVAAGCGATLVCGLAASAVGALGAVFALDRPDELGTATFDTGTLRLNQYTTTTYQTHLQGGSSAWSNWDYYITHTVSVVPTSAPLTPLN